MTYKTLDELILKKIASRDGVMFTDFYDGIVMTEASRIADIKGGENFRQLDRRLQALRKKGLIKYVNKRGWMIAERVK